MTVADNTSRNQYTATSGQTVFAYTFEIVDKDHVVVLKNGVALSEGTDYSVSNVGNDNGGNVTLTSGATAGDIMTLYRDMPYSRTQNYTNSGDFLASEVNSDFDELWLAGEQTDRAFSQSIRKPITDSDSISMELPEAATRANKFVKFDATGAVDVAGATVTLSAEDVSIDDAGNYYSSGNVEGALQEVGADLTANTAKLNTIETGADVTDTANVTAAGAVMDSELTNEAAVKALNQGVATTDSPTFTGATLGAVTYTSTDGTDGQVLMTNGAGVAAFEDMPSSTYLDVTDFGATGDGTTDDTTSIQNAINHASNNEIQTIFFPAGHYKYTTLRLYHDATDNPNFQGESASYTGDGSETVFAYGWPIGKASDLRVKVDGNIQTLDTDYTVSGVGNNSGGNITFISGAPANGLSVSIAEANRDGRFVFLGTGKLGLSDLNFLKTEPSRVYGSRLESTAGGSGLIVEPTGTFSGTDARNFRAENMTFIADNTGYIITSESCPGISFSNCSFKQLNTEGSGLKVRNSWFFTMNQCFVYGPSNTEGAANDPVNNTGDGITGASGRFGGEWNITDSLIDSFSNGVRWTAGEFVNVSLRNTAVQNCNNYGLYAEGGILQQLLFDNVYQENIGVRGRSFIKGTGTSTSGDEKARIRNLRMTSSFMYGPYMTGPLVDLDNVDSINCEHLYVFRPRQTFLNVTDTKNNQILSGKLENCTFTTEEDVAKYYTNVDGSTRIFTGPYAQVASDLVVYVDDGTGSNYTLTTDYTVSDLDNIDGATSTVTFNTAPVSGRSIKIIRPIDLLTGIMPSVNNCIYPTVDKGFYFTADPDGSTSRRQFIRLYDETTNLLPSYVDVKATTGIAKFGFGDTVVETITSSPYNIGGTAGRTYYDLTHSISTGLAVFLPDNTPEGDAQEINDGRLIIVKNNEATSSGYPYINVYNNSAQSIAIAQLSPGQAGLFIMDKQDGNKFRYTGRTFTNDLEMADNHKISFGRSDDLEIYHHSQSETFEDNAAGVTNFTYTFDSPAVSDHIKVERKPEGGSYSNVITFTVDLSTKTVVLATATTLNEDIRISASESRIDSLDGVVIDGLVYPTADGTSGQSIITDGSGNLTFGTAAGTGITAVVQDTTPQLGGDLESNGHDILFADNDKAIFGAGSDLQIYHDGTNSYIVNTTNDLIIGEDTRVRIKTPSLLVNNAADNENLLTATENGAVTLFYNNASKLATTSTGIDVTGSINTVLSVDGTTEDVFITGDTPALEFVESDNSGSRMRMAWATSGSFEPTLYQSLYGDTTSTFGGINIQTRTSDNSDNHVVYSYDPINDRNFWGTRGSPEDVAMQLQSDGTFNVRGGNVVFENSGATSDDFFWDASTSRLGLGTTSPDRQLSVNGFSGNGTVSINASTTGASTLYFADGNTGTSIYTGFIQYNHSTDTMQFATNGGQERMSITSAGALNHYGDSINAQTSAAYYVRNRVNGGSLNLGVETTAGSLYYPVVMNGTSDVLIFNNAEDEMARFDTSGNLLVRTTSSSTTSGAGLKLTKPTTSGNDDGKLAITGETSTSAQDAFQIYSTGASAYRCFINYAGSIYATSTSITAISDESLKENIRDLDKGLDTVLALQPRRFDWKNGDGNDIMGFVAQEVEEVMPELVHDYKYSETETKLGLKMGDMVPTLVKAIQDQQEIIENLKSRIEQLEGAN